MASTWLDQLYLMYRVIRYGGSALPSRPFFNFTGSGVTITDDPVNQATNILIDGGSGGGGITTIDASEPILVDIPTGPVVGMTFGFTGQVHGDVTFFNGTNWVRKGAGSAGQVLTTQGTSADPTWTSISFSGTDISGGLSSAVVTSLSGSGGSVTMSSANLLSGATPATTGRFRLSQADVISVRDSGNTVNINLWNTGSNNGTLGDASNLGSLEIGGGAFFDLNIRGTLTLESSSTQLIALVPMRFNNVSAPSTPTGGPVVYGVSGALTAKGTSGTVTTIAPA